MSAFFFVTAFVAQTATPTIAVQMGINQPVTRLAFSPDGHWLASGQQDGSITVWDWPSRLQAAHLYGHGQAIGALAFSPAGLTLASTARDGSIRLWRLQDGTQTASFPAPSGLGVTALRFSRDGTSLYAVGPNLFSVLDATTLKEIRSIKHELPWSVALSPDGKWIAVGGNLEVGKTVSSGPNVFVHDALTGMVKHSLRYDGRVRGLAFSPDGARLTAVGTSIHYYEKGYVQYGGGSIVVWDTASGKPLDTIASGYGDLNALEWSASGQVWVANDFGVDVWDVSRGPPAKQEWISDLHCNDLALSSNGDWLAVASDQGVLVRSTHGVEQALLAGPKISSGPMRFSADGEHLLAQASGRTVIWNAKKGELERAFPPSDALAMSTDGKSVALGYFDRLLLFDAATGSKLAEHALPARYAAAVERVEFSANARALYVDHKWYDVATRQALPKDVDSAGNKLFIPGERDLASSALPAFAPIRGAQRKFVSAEGSWILAGGAAGYGIYDGASGQKRYALPWNRPTEVNSVSFSRDGSLLAVSRSHAGSEVYVTATGKLLGSLPEERGELALSPDGTRLATAGPQRPMRLWQVSSMRPLATFAYQAGANSYFSSGKYLESVSDKGGGDYAVFTPGGFFKASKNGAAILSICAAAGCVSAEKNGAEQNRPALVEQALAQ